MRIKGNIFKGYDRMGSNRVNRGGSWNNNANNIRSANRNNNNPSNSNNNIGFRLVNTFYLSTYCVYGCNMQLVKMSKYIFLLPLKPEMPEEQRLNNH